MKVMKLIILTFALVCIVETQAVWSVELTPSNVVLPASPGGLLSFDLVISNTAPDVNVALFQCTIGAGPGGLTLDDVSSEAVSTDHGYWIYGNPGGGANADSLGGNNFRFSDNPGYPTAEILLAGDIMARFTFIWDGAAYDHTFTLDLDISNSYILLDDLFTQEALLFNPGNYPGSNNSFTVTIPEPTTACLLSLGVLSLLRRRRA